MVDELDGPFGDLYALLDPLERHGDPVDEAERRALLHALLSEPGANRDALRRIAFEDAISPNDRRDDAALVRRLLDRLDAGTLEAVRTQARVGGGASWQARGDGADVAAALDELADRARDAANDDEVKLKDWKLECAHHARRGRDLIERGTRIEVVPDVGTTSDRVLVHWRDDWQPSMPPALDVRTPGQPNATAPTSGASGPYTTYGLDARYLGDIDIRNILNPGFWTAFREPTRHRIQPGPTSIEVAVYNPRQFKLEFKLPPMAGFRDGSKYEARGGAEVKALAQHRTLPHRVETEDAFWSPSSLSLDVSRTSSQPGPDFEPSESEMKLVDTLALKRDGALVPDLDYLKLIGSILKYADTLRAIVKMVKDYAPKVGWYIDWNLQLMQGGAAVEWYWKEHTDHRVFQYIDFNLSLTLFSLTFEIGVGVSAASFKLQIYASLGGELAIEAGAKRDSPEGGPEITLPTVKGKIVGTLGARAEAGYVFQFNAKGETAIEGEAGLGINRRGAMLGGDLKARWTGITCTATLSGGFLGVSFNETKKLDLVPASPWWGLSFPSETEYRPPTMSETAIAGVIEGVLRRGMDLLVYDDAGDVRYTHRAVASYLAEWIVKDRAFDQTPENVDLLANAIRQDLDRLGERSWERDWVAISALRRYVRGGLQVHLEAAASPTKKLMAANA